MTGRTNGGHVVTGYDLLDLLGRAHEMGATGVHIGWRDARGRAAVHYRRLSQIDPGGPGWQVFGDDSRWHPVNFVYPLGEKGVSLKVSA